MVIMSNECYVKFGQDKDMCLAPYRITSFIRHAMYPKGMIKLPIKVEIQREIPGR